MDEDSYIDVDGVWMSKLFHEKSIRSAFKFKPRHGDIITVAYPKCGTHWIQFIVRNIVTRANPDNIIIEHGQKFILLEFMGAESAEKPSRNGPVATHLPMRVFRPVQHAKYIYVARNPYDCAVSLYLLLRGLTPKTATDISFERFLPMFLKGKVIYGNYFDHLIPWYQRRNDNNVLFITYEQLKEDFRAQVLRIGDFVGKEHGDALRRDGALLRMVINACSLQNMKVFFKDKLEEKLARLIEAANEPSLPVENLINFKKDQANMHECSEFVRKEIIGDWKNYFTSEQIEHTKA